MLDTSQNYLERTAELFLIGLLVNVTASPVWIQLCFGPIKINYSFTSYFADLLYKCLFCVSK